MARVALVAGATRGAGRGIATALGERGMVVYCTGRSSRAHPGERPETIEETAERVTAAGGVGIPVRVDHRDEAQVTALMAQIQAEHGGLDLLVNDIWGADDLIDFGVPLEALVLDHARRMWDSGLWTHLVTARCAAPLLRPGALVVEVTDGDTFGYRGALVYDLVKMSVIRLAFGLHHALRPRGITALAVTPGFLRSEAMLERFGVTEATWRDGAAVDPNFVASETPLFVGRAVAALAGDPNVAARGGRVFSSWALAHEYGFTDADGSRPDWGAHWLATYGVPYAPADAAAYATWSPGPAEIAFGG